MVNQEPRNGKLSALYILPIMFVAFLVPLIVYVKVLSLQTDVSMLFAGVSKKPDIFSYYKMLVLVIAVAVLWLMTLYAAYKRKIIISWKMIYIPMAVYALLAILSAILADHRSVAIFGIPDQWEGLLSIIAYLSLPFLVVNLVTEEKKIRLLLASLLSSSFIIACIGLLQFIGHDPFSWQVVKKMIIPLQYHASLMPSFQLYFDKGTAYGTLVNPNYAGVFAGMVFVFAFLSLVAGWEKLKKPINIYMFIGCLMIGSFLIASNSRTSWVAVIASVLVIMLISYKIWWPQWRLVTSFSIAMLVIFIGMNYIAGGGLFQRVTSIESQGLKKIAESSGPKISDITMNNDGVQFVTEHGTIYMIPQKNSIFISDGKKPLSFKKNTNGIEIADKRFQGFVLQTRGNLVRIFYDRYDLVFYVTPDRIYNLTYRGEKVILGKTVPHWGFEGKERFFGGRGYIWSRTIPLLKDTVFIGHGPDTFEWYFPYEDYLGKLNAGMPTAQKVERPHNQYLQIAVNTGVVSMVCFIAILLVYLYQSFRIYRGTMDFKRNFYYIIGLASMGAVLAYSISALGNDSVVAVAPVFWILLGLGMVCNEKVRNLPVAADTAVAEIVTKVNSKQENTSKNREKTKQKPSVSKR